MKASLKFVLLLLPLMLSACAVEPTPAASGKEITFKNTVVTLTFDDGNADNYQTRAVLKENNLRATFYVVSGFTGKPGYVTADELRGLHEDGNEIGGHTLNHTKLSDVRGEELKREICEDRENLLAYGFDVKSFAYPFGYHDEEAKQAVIECGYANARAVTGGPEKFPPSDAYRLKAMPYVVRGTRPAKLKGYVTGVEEEGGGWVIFTFHHICNKCDKFGISLRSFTELAEWLGEQQENGLMIKTMGEALP